jgi:hypothetical protein
VKRNKTKDFSCWVTLREAAPRLRPSTQPTRKFIKALKIKGYDFYLTRVIEERYSSKALVRHGINKPPITKH